MSRHPLAALGALALAACAPDAPTYARLLGRVEGDSVRIVLLAQPGVRVSALQPPRLESSRFPGLVFAGALDPSDSTYFTGPLEASAPGAAGRIRGELVASVCVNDERVCRVVRQPVRFRVAREGEAAS